MFGKQNRLSAPRLLHATLAILGGFGADLALGDAARAQQEAPAEVLAAQVRTHGFTCDKPLGAESHKI